MGSVGLWRGVKWFSRPMERCEVVGEAYGEV